jgi:hypothetical protein
MISDPLTLSDQSNQVPHYVSGNSGLRRSRTVQTISITDFSEKRPVYSISKVTSDVNTILNAGELLIHLMGIKGDS